jgi:CubicO group peptidase (beta-lactamase class C family)
MLKTIALVLALCPLQASDSKLALSTGSCRPTPARAFPGRRAGCRQREVILQSGYGLANVELNVPNTPETKFRIGSLTKQFTAMLVVQLAAEGKLKLDGKVSDYLPEYPKASGEQITIHHLLTHQSGIADFSKAEFLRYSREYVSQIDLAKLFWEKPLAFSPGTKYSYSNPGYQLLGVLIERVAGKLYEQVLKERICEPLGMRDTGYDHSDAILLATVPLAMSRRPAV